MKNPPFDLSSPFIEPVSWAASPLPCILCMDMQIIEESRVRHAPNTCFISRYPLVYNCCNWSHIGLSLEQCAFPVISALLIVDFPFLCDFFLGLLFQTLIPSSDSGISSPRESLLLRPPTLSWALSFSLLDSWLGCFNVWLPLNFQWRIP